MNFTKRTIAALLAAFTAATMLASCGGSDDNSKTADNTASQADSLGEAAGNEESETDKPKPEAIVGEVRDMTAAELIAEMNAGWNMGNSLDATTGGETGWGNPEITPEMIKAVHDKGFDILRLPVTWAEHMGDAPDYTIDPDWLDRVQEVVNYAIEEDMYVMLNTHHEEGWLIPDAEHQENNKAAIKAIWQQLCERFGEYGDHLIFEGLNEPRTVGSAKEWSGGTPEERKYVSELNEVFYETVRASGGKNEKRLLMMTSYAGSVVKEAIDDVYTPENDEHFAMSLHAYTPYGFTYQPANWAYTEWDGSHEGEIVSMIEDLKEHFLSRGIPVIITEFGAFNAWNDEDVARWAEFYAKTAMSAGIPCIVWDNGSFLSGETFALFNRNECTWYRESYADALIKGAEEGKQS